MIAGLEIVKGAARACHAFKRDLWDRVSGSDLFEWPEIREVNLHLQTRIRQAWDEHLGVCRYWVKNRNMWAKTTFPDDALAVAWVRAEQHSAFLDRLAAFMGGAITCHPHSDNPYLFLILLWESAKGPFDQESVYQFCQAYSEAFKS